IEVDNLTKRYGRTTEVDGISFVVKKGEILGFLGPNGAGKTTTMRILTCYLPPTEGTARVAGHDVFLEPLEVKKRVGYIPTWRWRRSSTSAPRSRASRRRSARPAWTRRWRSAGWATCARR